MTVKKSIAAVKCNEDPAVLAVLAQLGTGFDCASKVSNTCVCILTTMCSLYLRDYSTEFYTITPNFFQSNLVT